MLVLADPVSMPEVDEVLDADGCPLPRVARRVATLDPPELVIPALLACELAAAAVLPPAAVAPPVAAPPPLATVPTAVPLARLVPPAAAAPAPTAKPPMAIPPARATRLATPVVASQARRCTSPRAAKTVSPTL